MTLNRRPTVVLLVILFLVIGAAFLTQLIPSRTFDFRGQLQAIVYGALED